MRKMKIDGNEMKEERKEKTNGSKFMENKFSLAAHSTEIVYMLLPYPHTYYIFRDENRETEKVRQREVVA